MTRIRILTVGCSGATSRSLGSKLKTDFCLATYVTPDLHSEPGRVHCGTAKWFVRTETTAERVREKGFTGLLIVPQVVIHEVLAGGS